jgi:hypothetical protein
VQYLFFLNRTIYEITWKNIRARNTKDNNIIWSMRFACRITKAVIQTQTQNTYCFFTAKLVTRTRLCYVTRILPVLLLFISPSHPQGCGPGSSVGIATDYGLDGPGIESRWGRDFPPVQTGPGAHPASCTMGTGSFPGVKCGRGVLLTTHPLLVPRSWKSRAIPLPTPWATPDL